ncbi:MAG: hypothetical protein N3F66_00890 [Spirochaetes bacterium]|nr:hypothetical protein [Spirochaetota bacterium]
MPLFEWVKIIITISVLIFITVFTEMSLLWFVSCIIFAFIYYSNIPAYMRYTLIIIIPLVITIIIMQIVSGLIFSQYNVFLIIQTTFKIVCATIIIIGSRFFIGSNGFKAFINVFPDTIKLFFLVFTRILYKLLRLNTMIVYQIQSRINMKSNEKYYIPKYYSVAFVSNQFYSLAHYRNGIISRTADTIPEIIIYHNYSMKEYIVTVLIIILLIINIIF